MILRRPSDRGSLTYGSDELVKAAEGKQRLWKLSQEKLERSSDDVDLFPLSVLQVQLLLCGAEEEGMNGGNQQRLKEQEEQEE